ncbi:phosphatase PAP2 family protein [Desulfocurvus sp. DL9XJH121]
MRYASLAGHYLLISAPLLFVLALEYLLIGPERDVLQFFRLHKADWPALGSAFSVATNWGNPFMYLAFAGIFVHGLWRNDSRRVRYVLTYIVVQLVVCLALVNLVKMGLGRPRPETGEFINHFMTLDSLYHSLPSGHTAEFTGTCLALGLWVRRFPHSLLLGVLLAFMGFSRIYLNHHYPSDVLFGWMFGSLAGWATYAFGGGKDSPYHE